MPHKPAEFDDRPIQRVSDLLAAGYHATTLDRAVAAGALVRVAHGILATPRAAISPRLNDALVALAIPGAVLSGQAAAYRHDLSDEIPDRVGVVAPRGRTRLPSALRFVELRATTAPALLSEHVVADRALGVPLRLTSPARTVLDLYLTGGVHAFAIEALRRFLDRGGTIAEIARVARAYRPIRGALPAAPWQRLLDDAAALDLATGARP